LYSFGEPHDS